MEDIMLVSSKWFVRMFLVIALSTAGSALAAVYKCEVNGQIAFQSLPCTKGEQSLVKGVKAIIGGFNSSWFERPSMISGFPKCNSAGCICGGIMYKKRNDEKIWLLNSMGALRGNWSSYQMSLGSYRNTLKYGSSVSKRKSLEKLGCEIAVNQAVIKELYDSVSIEIESNYRALSKGHNLVKSECEEPSEEGWTHSSDAKKWAKCKKKNISDHNETLRYKRKFEGLYDTLMLESELLRKPRAQ